MAEHSKIEWTDSTFNPWIGCQKVSPGCDHCYAEAMMDHRYGRVKWGPKGERVRTAPANWKKPIAWNNQADYFYRFNGRRQRVFCASLSDVFDNKAPKGARDDLWKLIASTRELNWMLLTKRPENIGKMLPADWGDGYPNVWLGTTCEDQERYDHRWPILRQVPAVVRFISYEPAIGKLQLFGEAPFPDWFICGGETGAGARTMDSNWARQVKSGCEYHGIAFFMKQMAEKAPIPADLMLRQFPEARL